MTARVAKSVAIDEGERPVRPFIRMNPEQDQVGIKHSRSEQESHVGLVVPTTTATASMSRIIGRTKREQIVRKARRDRLRGTEEVVFGFRSALTKSYGGVVRGWRVVLDPSMAGRITYNQLCTGCSRMMFRGNMALLFDALDANNQKFLTVVDVDKRAAENLFKLRTFCVERWGDLDATFRALDTDHSGKINRSEFAALLQAAAERDAERHSSLEGFSHEQSVGPLPFDVGSAFLDLAEQQSVTSSVTRADFEWLERMWRAFKGDAGDVLMMERRNIKNPQFDMMKELARKARLSVIDTVAHNPAALKKFSVQSSQADEQAAARTSKKMKKATSFGAALFAPMARAGLRRTKSAAQMLKEGTAFGAFKKRECEPPDSTDLKAAAVLEKLAAHANDSEVSRGFLGISTQAHVIKDAGNRKTAVLSDITETVQTRAEERQMHAIDVARAQVKDRHLRQRLYHVPGETQLSRAHRAEGKLKRMHLQATTLNRSTDLIQNLAVSNFRQMLRNLGRGSILRAWRRAIDVTGQGYVTQHQFLVRAKKLHFSGNLAAVWAKWTERATSFTADGDPVLTPWDLQPMITARLRLLKKAFNYLYGMDPRGWMKSADVDASGQVERGEFVRMVQHVELRLASVGAQGVAAADPLPAGVQGTPKIAGISMHADPLFDALCVEGVVRLADFSWMNKLEAPGELVVVEPDEYGRTVTAAKPIVQDTAQVGSLNTLLDGFANLRAQLDHNFANRPPPPPQDFVPEVSRMLPPHLRGDDPLRTRTAAEPEIQELSGMRAGQTTASRLNETVSRRAAAKRAEAAAGVKTMALMQLFPSMEGDVHQTPERSPQKTVWGSMVSPDEIRSADRSQTQTMSLLETLHPGESPGPRKPELPDERKREVQAEILENVCMIDQLRTAVDAGHLVLSAEEEREFAKLEAEYARALKKIVEKRQQS